MLSSSEAVPEAEAQGTIMIYRHVMLALFVSIWIPLYCSPDDNESRDGGLAPLLFTIMLLEILSISLSLIDAIVAAQSVVCIPGQCLEGFTNTTLGISVSSASLPASLLLLPGSYTSTTNPQFLHQALTSSSSTFTTSPGFTNS